MTHVARYLEGVKNVAAMLCDPVFPYLMKIEALVEELDALRTRKGRLFLIGIGGSAANCGHAVNDFQKLCDIDAHALTDNVAEFSARINDDGWNTVFVKWLRSRRLSRQDAVMVFSVGGGDKEKNISANIVEAVFYAKSLGACVLGIVGRDDGYTAVHGDAVVVVPMFAPDLLTPISESFQAVIWHALVSHPKLAVQKAKWEGAAA